MAATKGVKHMSRNREVVGSDPAERWAFSYFIFSVIHPSNSLSIRCNSSEFSLKIGLALQP